MQRSIIWNCIQFVLPLPVLQGSKLGLLYCFDLIWPMLHTVVPVYCYATCTGLMPSRKV